jgi:hypothetical protein
VREGLYFLRCIIIKNERKENLMFGKKYQKLCLKAFSNEISNEEKKELDTWLNSSESNKMLYDEFLNIWTTSGTTNIPEIPDIENEWKVLYNTLDLDNKVNPEYPDKFKFKMVPGGARQWSSKILRPALTGVFLILISFILLLFYQQDKNTPVWKSVDTKNKEHIQIQLSDGSIVELNSGSKIS